MEEIDLIDMFKYYVSKKILIILVGIICVILAIVYTKFLLVPEYTATSKFILTNIFVCCCIIFGFLALMYVQ